MLVHLWIQVSIVKGKWHNSWNSLKQNALGKRKSTHLESPKSATFACTFPWSSLCTRMFRAAKSRWTVFLWEKSGYSHSVLSPSPLLPPLPPSHSHSPSLPLSRQMHLQFICEIVHAISDMVGIRQLPGEGHAWPGVFQHTQQVTLIHVLLNKQQRVVPVINRIILYVSFGFPSITFLIRWAVELP